MSSKHTKKTDHSLFAILANNAPNRVFISLVFGIFAGLAYSMIIPLILLSLQPPAHRLLDSVNPDAIYVFSFQINTPVFALAFLGICLFVLITRVASETLLVRVATDAMVDLRKQLYLRIANAPIQTLEHIGPSRLLSALTTDVPKVVNGASLLPAILISSATVMGLLGYLVYLNKNIFIFILGAIVIGIITYRIPFYFGDRYYTKARKYFDNLQQGMEGLIYGAKELKLNRSKRENYIDSDLHHFENKYGQTQKRAETLMTFAVSYGDLLSFFIIGIVTYGLAGYYGLNTQSTIGIVMALLYISSPLGVILNSLAPAMKAAVSLRNIRHLLSELPVEKSWHGDNPLTCRALTLSNIEYRHQSPVEGEKGFQVGPVDLTVRGGEIVFLVGGNGSGKSTLAKLISLHYFPSSGAIYFDDVAVTDVNREQHRQNIGAIYSDFYLFTRLYLEQEKLAAAEPLIQQYLHEFSLEDKVSIADGQFSTLALSDGQRRRLALLVAFLEDRSIYIFDEWAADQDPQSREIFYCKVLPELKRSGKMVIIISHDDRYFHTADRVLKMEDGQLVEDSYTQTAASMAN